ncbi:MAG: CAP domain-containing protein [Acidimicrobiia bacterium]|nr:CAP domain-containing protein [Acidimicrobiia bacterium]
MDPTTANRRPRRHRLIAAALAALAGVGLALGVAPAARADSNLDEAQFFADLNLVRARNGVPPLATDGQLISVARGWSAQMAGPAGLSHNPNLASQISNWRTLGENVGTGSTVPQIEAALEASPHHFENMVDPAFQYVGIGVVESAGVIWVTEDFKQAKSGSLPSTQLPAPAPKPAPRPPAPPRPAAPTPPSPARSATGATNSPAAPPAAGAGAGASSAGATQAPAPPAPSVSPQSSEPARSHGARTLPSGLAVVSSSPIINGSRAASLILFVLLGGVAVLATKGRLPGVRV